MQDGLTIRYKFDFRQAADERRRQAISRARKREWAEKKANPPDGPSRVARLLATAYFIERGFADGTIRNFEEARDVLGVSPSRVSQILALANLSAPLQEGILLGQDHRSEVPLRAVATKVLWRRP
jgi:hypothetical protein